MDSLIAVAAIGFVGSIVSAVVLYTNRRRNGRNGSSRTAIDPEHAKSGDLAAAFWLQQFKLIYDTLNLHAAKMDGFGVKIDALRAETMHGFGSTNTLLQDILRELRHNNGRAATTGRRDAGL